MLLELRPYRHHCCVGKEAHHDACLLCGLIDGEEGLARHPAVGLSLLVGLALTLSDDHVETVVPEVAGLSWPLYTVTDYGDLLVLEYFPCFFKREFIAGDDILVHSAKVHNCHNFVLFIC